MMPRTRRQPHPDDVLRRLARGQRPIAISSLYSGYRKPRDPQRAGLYALVAMLAVALIVALVPFAIPRNAVFFDGELTRRSFNTEGLAKLEIKIRTRPITAVRAAVVTLDGAPAIVTRTGDAMIWKPQTLVDGPHRLTVRSGGRVLWRSGAVRTFSFVVDSVAPTLTIDAPTGSVVVNEPFVLRGRTDGSVVSVDGKTAAVRDGAFMMRFAHPPIGRIIVTASDDAGNTVTSSSRTRVQLPALRAVHMSAISWVTPSLKDPVMRMADAGQINAIQLDLKDENGEVGYRSGLRAVNDIGAGKGYYDLGAAVAELHGRKLRVVGRIVVFRDPLLTRAAWNAGNKDEVIQDDQGQQYKSRYGGFANPASKAVQDYILAIAREAADAGVDDILFDYIRRPEGDITKMRFVGLVGDDPTKAIDETIVAFLRRAGEALRPTPARLGVSVFGIAAKTPGEVGQNVPAMAGAVDYIAPMVYPSHWTPGQYNVSNPVAEPFLIVSRSLTKFKELVTASDSDAVIIPWLQDFSLGSTYGPKEVRAQIDAAASLQLPGFLLWDPKVTYSVGGIPTGAPQLPFGGQVVSASAAVESSTASVATAAVVPGNVNRPAAGALAPTVAPR